MVLLPSSFLKHAGQTVPSLLSSPEQAGLYYLSQLPIALSTWMYTIHEIGFVRFPGFRAEKGSVEIDCCNALGRGVGA
jgi:hypothetical protein